MPEQLTERGVPNGSLATSGVAAISSRGITAVSNNGFAAIARSRVTAVSSSGMAGQADWRSDTSGSRTLCRQRVWRAGSGFTAKHLGGCKLVPGPLAPGRLTRARLAPGGTMQERLAASGSTQERLTASRLFKERDVEVGLLEEGRGRAQTHGGAALLGGLLEELRAAGGVLDERLAGAD